VNLEQAGSVGGSLIALGDHLSNLGLLLIGKLRTAPADASFLSSVLERVSRANSQTVAGWILNSRAAAATVLPPFETILREDRNDSRHRIQRAAVFGQAVSLAANQEMVQPAHCSMRLWFAGGPGAARTIL
jgi:hypothetical protein